MPDRAQHSTVLIVEEDAPLAALLGDLLLELPGLGGLVASDTVAAHKIFTERHPDLLLLNVNLPRSLRSRAARRAAGRSSVG
jgi:DNA-binding response OmpR family regulator